MSRWLMLALFWAGTTLFLFLLFVGPQPAQQDLLLWEGDKSGPLSSITLFGEEERSFRRDLAVGSGWSGWDAAAEVSSAAEAALRSAPAEGAFVEAVLKHLSQIPLADPIPIVDAETFGFSPGGEELRLVGSGRRRDFELGRTVPYLRQRYLRESGGTVAYLLSADFLKALALPKEDWWDRRLAPLSWDDVFSLKLERPLEPVVEVTRRPDEQWTLAQPVRAAAEQAQADLVLSTVAALRATGFSEVQPTSAPCLNLTFGLRGGLKFALKLYPLSEDEEIAVSDYQRAAVIIPRTSDRIPASNRLRQRLITDFDLDDLETATFRSKIGASVVIAKTKDGRWTVNGRPGHAVFVQELFKELGKLNVDQFVSEQSTPVGWTDLVLRIDLGFRFKRAWIEIGRSAERTDIVLVRASDSAETGIMNRQALRRIVPREEVLVE